MMLIMLLLKIWQLTVSYKCKTLSKKSCKKTCENKKKVVTLHPKTVGLRWLDYQLTETERFRGISEVGSLFVCTYGSGCQMYIFYFEKT